MLPLVRLRGLTHPVVFFILRARSFFSDDYHRSHVTRRARLTLRANAGCSFRTYGAGRYPEASNLTPQGPTTGPLSVLAWMGSTFQQKHQIPAAACTVAWPALSPALGERWNSSAFLFLSQHSWKSCRVRVRNHGDNPVSAKVATRYSGPQRTTDRRSGRTPKLSKLCGR